MPLQNINNQNFSRNLSLAVIGMTFLLNALRVGEDVVHTGISVFVKLSIAAVALLTGTWDMYYHDNILNSPEGSWLLTFAATYPLLLGAFKFLDRYRGRENTFPYSKALLATWGLAQAAKISLHDERNIYNTAVACVDSGVAPVMLFLNGHSRHARRLNDLEIMEHGIEVPLVAGALAAWTMYPPKLHA